MDNLEAQIVDQVRVNTAFEQMIVSVLIGASLGGAALFLFNLFAAIVGGYLWFDFFVGQFVNALLYAFVIFLAGFLAAAILAAPLFVALEKIPYRQTWPFIIAAVFFEFVLYALFFKDFADAQAGGLTFKVAMFAPGVIVALIFGRRMQPFWRAAAKAEQALPVHQPRLH